MGQICSLCRNICSCCKRKEPQKRKKPNYRSWKKEESITPSDIPMCDLTSQFQVPSNQFDYISDVFEMRGYDYNKREQIGKGGNAIVYKIKKIKDKRIFALKEIKLSTVEYKRDPTKIEDLKNEIFIIYKVKHKNIIQLLDSFIINNMCYLVLELANSGTVQHQIDKSGAMSEINAKTYFYQIVKAIAYLHLHKPPIAHRDLKLPNILIHIKNNEKILKVTDFGFSRVLTEKAEGKLFRIKEPKGTPPYLSPQLVRLVLHINTINPKEREDIQQLSIKVKTVNPIRADIWSLGVCLYYMISADYPFDIPLNIKTLEQQLNRERKPIDKKISGLLTHLLDQMLEPEIRRTVCCIGYERIDISGIVEHPWLADVPHVIKVKPTNTIKAIV